MTPPAGRYYCMLFVLTGGRPHVGGRAVRTRELLNNARLWLWHPPKRTP
jgi:hypothetical protein